MLEPGQTVLGTLYSVRGHQTGRPSIEHRRSFVYGLVFLSRKSVRDPVLLMEIS